MQRIHFERGGGVLSFLLNTKCMYYKTLYVTCSVYTLRQVKGYQVSCLTLSVCIVKLFMLHAVYTL